MHKAIADAIRTEVRAALLGSDEAVPIKAVSYNEIISRVAEAIYKVACSMDCYCYVEFVYPENYAIVCKEGVYYRVEYTLTDDSVTVTPPDEWRKVEREWRSATPALRTMHGGAIKALENGHIGGYLVTFGSPEQPDLYGDFFTSETDFGFDGEMKTAVYFNHRLPIKTRSGDFFVVKSKIGEGTLTKDEKGILIDAILFNRDEYEQALAALGWSSGTAEHLIETEKVGKAYWIRAWPLGLDASITPKPAEPRNAVLPLKSLLGQGPIIVIP